MDTTPTTPDQPEKPSKRRLQAKLIVNLMKFGTIAQAARATGISKRTAFNWLKDDGFRKKYRQARDAAILAAAGQLHARTHIAIGTLLRTVKDADTNPAVKVQACGLILTWATRLAEQLDLGDRIDRLEQQSRENS
jgi:hypothetical protein